MTGEIHGQAETQKKNWKQEAQITLESP